MDDVMLSLTGIVKKFNPGTVNEKVALNGLDLQLKNGDFVTVIGGNGAGKSTMLNAISGAWRVDSGSIVLDGVNKPRAGVAPRQTQDVCSGYKKVGARVIPRNAYGT